jgi:hypothetical protein
VSDSASHARKQTRLHRTSTERASQDTPRLGVAREPSEDTARQDEGYKTDVNERGRSRLSAWRLRRRSQVSTGAGSPASRSLPGGELESARRLPLRQGNADLKRSSTDERCDHLTEGLNGFLENTISHTKAQRESRTRFNGQDFDRGSPLYPDSGRSSVASACLDQPLPLQALSGNITAQRPDRADSGRSQDPTGRKALANNDPDTARLLPQGPRPDPARPTLGTVLRSRPVESAGSGVRAMAAMFEGTSKDTTGHPSSEKAAKPSGILSPYTVNPSPEKPPSKPPKQREPVPSGRHTWLFTTRDGRSRGSGPAVRGEAIRGNGDSDHGQGRMREAARGKRAGARPSIRVPPENEDTAGFQLPEEQRDTPKQPGAPTSAPSGRETTRGPPSIRDIPSQERHQTPPSATRTDEPPPKYKHSTPSPSPNPHLHSQSNLCPNSPQDEEVSPASTTRRFPLVPTPERELARLGAQLGQAEQECAMWRARAERAEERVRVLEGGFSGVGVGNGIGVGGAGAESCVDGDGEVGTRGLMVDDDDGGKGEGPTVPRSSSSSSSNTIPSMKQTSRGRINRGRRRRVGWAWGWHKSPPAPAAPPAAGRWRW